jgi:acyl-CoA thioesterase I
MIGFRYAGVAGWVALCLLASGCSNGPKASAQPASAPAPSVPATGDARPKVVVLGDSLTAGLGLVETQSFPGLLQQKVDGEGWNFEIVNAGVSGDTSAGGLRRLDWILSEDVSVLVLALGANDGLRGLSVAAMKQNLSRIIETARQKNAVVILAGMEAPPNYGAEYVAAYRQTYREIAAQHRVLFIPFLLEKVAGEAALNQADGIHPNAKGAAIVAETVWSVLKPLLDQMSSS